MTPTRIVTPLTFLPPDLDLAAGSLLPAFDRERVTDQLQATFTTADAPYWAQDSRAFLGVSEGRAWRLEVGLGTVALRAFSPAGVERRATNRDTDALAPVLKPGSLFAAMERDARFAGDVIAGDAQWLGVRDPGWNHQPTPASRVSEWSWKSRARMLRAFAELDYRIMEDQPGIAAMITLTYPGAWEALAPTAASAKRHVRMLLDRYSRAFGFRPAGLWKQEFQRRGAPHFHLFVKVAALAPSPFCSNPLHAQTVSRASRDGLEVCTCWTFEQWLSLAWALVVDADGPEFVRHLKAGTGVDFGAASNCTDGKRLAVYFLKHGTKTKDGKEYQNHPPALWDIKADTTTGEVTDDGGTGRFWGYWGLKRQLAIIDLPMTDYYALRRLLRASRSRILGVHICPVTGRRWGTVVSRRKVWGLGARGGNSGGWALVNDGPSYAATLARALASR